MFRRLRTGRTRWFAAAAVTLALVGGGVYVAIPAQAATSVTDGFEGNPYTQWTTTDRPGDSLVWLGDHTQSRTGGNAGWFYAPYDVQGRAYRSLVVDRPSPNPSWCFGEAWVKKPDTWPDTPGTENSPQVTLRIRAGGPSGPTISGTVYNLTNLEYGRASFASFAYQRPDLTVDITVTNGMAFVDDVTVRCIQDIR